MGCMADWVEGQGLKGDRRGSGGGGGPAEVALDRVAARHHNVAVPTRLDLCRGGTGGTGIVWRRGEAGGGGGGYQKERLRAVRRGERGTARRVQGRGGAGREGP